jgi:acyl carrier protein
MTAIYDRAGDFDPPGGGASIGGVAGDSVKARLFGVVGALMQRRQLAIPTSLDQSLRDAGLKSLDLVNMMLAVEDEFGIEIPQDLLSIENFRTIGAIERLVAKIAAQ